MTNCRSYYRFLLLCVIGLIVGGALNTHVELELEQTGNSWVKFATQKEDFEVILSEL